MFSAMLRTQLLATARVARPASRNLSALAAFRVLPAPTRITASRTFSQSAIAAMPQSRNPPSSILYLGNLPWSTNKEEVRELLAEFGAIQDIRFAMSPDGRPRGFAHIVFADQASAEAAISSANEEPLHLNGRDLYADFALDRQAASAPEPINKLYFNNFEGDESALRELLADYNDQITSIFFMRDNITGQTQRNGFVEFETIPQATTVLDAFANSEAVNLSYARPRRERRPSDRYNDNRSGGDRYGGDRYGGNRDRGDRYGGDRPNRYGDKPRDGPYHGRGWEGRE